MYNYECTKRMVFKCAHLRTYEYTYVGTVSTYKCRSFYAPEVIIYEELQKCRQADTSKNKKKNILSRLDYEKIKRRLVDGEIFTLSFSFCIFDAWYRAAVRRSSANDESV